MTTATHDYPTGLLRWAITATVMLVTIMEILDMTIVTVALPPMQGQLGANADNITWVLTSYIVSAAIIMPLTGFIVARLGRKRYMIIMIVGFLISSMLCGISQNLAQIVVFRILQGIFGASLVPMSQYILNDTFPPDKAGVAMAIWGVGVMLAPVMGPTLGGYISNNSSWRWIFYINVPVCILAFFMTLQFIEETPREKVKIDWVGLLLMAVGVACLQIFLDRGNTDNWFASRSIQILCLVSVFSLAIFIVRGIGKKDNIVNLNLFKDRNFSLATALLCIFAMSIFAVISVQPIMLENLMNYNAETAGLLMMPRGIASVLGMMTVAKLMNKVDGRAIIFTGVAFCAYGTYQMMHLNLDASFSVMAMQGALQGYGMGLFFVPVAAYSLGGLAKKDRAEGAGLYSFGRNLGSSLGISIVSTIISQQSQVNWNRLGGNLKPNNLATQNWLHQVQHIVTPAQSFAHLGQTLYLQSSMIAFLDSYWSVMIAFIFMLPLVLALKKVKLESTSVH